MSRKQVVVIEIWQATFASQMVSGLSAVDSGVILRVGNDENTHGNDFCILK